MLRHSSTYQGWLSDCLPRSQGWDYDERFAMTDTRDRSRFAGLALVLATIFGLLFWVGVAYAVVPKSWITWPKVHGCVAVQADQGTTIKPVVFTELVVR
jgi:hypothetical protein